ncbi:MAG: hypothetical protein ACU0CI_08950 [Shimia sp.]
MARFLFLCGLLFAAPTASAQVAALCGDETIRDQCRATCAPACGDRAFLSANVDYCVDNGFLVPDLSVLGLRDDPQCAGFLGNEGVQEERDCASIEGLFDRLECESRSAGEPTCAPSPEALRQRASVLALTGRENLLEYSELLNTNWGAVSNRDALCSFTRDELEQAFVQATREPEEIQAFRTEANLVGDCANEWEGFVRDTASASVSDSLADNLSNQLQADIIPLREAIAELSRALVGLETAGEQILEVGRQHRFFCSSGAVPQNEKETRPIAEVRAASLRSGAPACSGSLLNLEERISVLVFDVNSVLSSHGVAISKAYSVENRGDLCRIPLRSLDQAYDAATENVDNVAALRPRFVGLEACLVDWEEFIYDKSGTAGSDVLRDRLTRDAEARLEPLRAQIGGLNTSIQTLEDAAGTIVQMVDLHLIYCDPEGEAQPAPSDG